MDVDGSQARMAAFLRDHQDKIVGRWSELVVAGVRGRSSVVEARRELEDIYSLIVAVMSGPGESGPGAQARVELRRRPRPRWPRSSASRPASPSRCLSGRTGG
jgi:rsbT co-antagonist protein RsbR